MSTRIQKLHTRAKALFESNQLKEALAAYKTICKQAPADMQACHMAGAISGMLGEFDSALVYCEKVVALTPRSHGPRMNLANVYMAMGDYSKAESCLQSALKLSPGDAQILCTLGALYTKLNRIEAAITCLQQAIKEDPSSHEAHNNLGIAYLETGNTGAAETCFHKALTLQPAFIDALCNLGGVFSNRCMFDKAENCYTTALRHAPNNKSALTGLGNLYQSEGKFEEAKGVYLKALSDNPDDEELVSSLATLHERCGNHDEAIRALEPTIRSNRYSARSALIYSTLCRKQNRQDKAVPIIESLLDSPQNKTDRTNLLFALGDLRDDLQEYDKAFESFQSANLLDTDVIPDNGYTSGIKSITRFYNARDFKHMPRAGNNSQLPIFIVGMPRSGTSLVEQILATHTDVTPGGEREDIIEMAGTLEVESGMPRAFTTRQLDIIATRYLEIIGTHSDDSLRFTDKTPLNGMHLGFINLLLPASKVIICKRNPLDTCLSIYFHRFNNYHSYAKDLATLGNFYRIFYELIDHWSSFLDIQMMEVQYEDLVNDTASKIHDIIDFCNLEWEPECLNFHKNKRTLNTPSYDQVRSPIYSSSINRWKNYEKHIGPLIDAIQN